MELHALLQAMPFLLPLATIPSPRDTPSPRSSAELANVAGISPPIITSEKENIVKPLENTETNKTNRKRKIEYSSPYSLMVENLTCIFSGLCCWVIETNPVSYLYFSSTDDRDPAQANFELKLGNFIGNPSLFISVDKQLYKVDHLQILKLHTPNSDKPPTQHITAFIKFVFPFISLQFYNSNLNLEWKLACDTLNKAINKLNSHITIEKSYKKTKNRKLSNYTRNVNR